MTVMRKIGENDNIYGVTNRPQTQDMQVAKQQKYIKNVMSIPDYLKDKSNMPSSELYW